MVNQRRYTEYGSADQGGLDFGGLWGPLGGLFVILILPDLGLQH